VPILLEHIQLNDEDLKDTKHLAEILKYKNNSIKTIINVLEWEDSNIRYCYEKSNVYYFITFFIIVGLVWAIFPEVWLWCEQVFCISPTIHIIICCLYFIITIILFLFLCGVVGTFLHLWATFFTLSKCDSKILKLKEGLFTTLSLIWISTSLKTILGLIVSFVFIVLTYEFMGTTFEEYLYGPKYVEFYKAANLSIPYLLILLALLIGVIVFGWAIIYYQSYKDASGTRYEKLKWTFYKIFSRGFFLPDILIRYFKLL